MRRSSSSRPGAVPLSRRCGAALGALVFAVPTGAFVVWLADYVMAEAMLSWAAVAWFAGGLAVLAFASPRRAADFLGRIWDGLSGVLRHGPP
ncbi:MAG: hypothetical protein HY749_10055 [Gammaproteobacteria bacterium]|nr:hypothetical protein [Gammaproteobacteria bacterium]MBI5615716.1 hypothetical protein [Gammaproteobacteria bacterium]